MMRLRRSGPRAFFTPMHRVVRLIACVAFTAAIGLVAPGCGTRSKTHLGRTVLSTHWINGRVAYRLDDGRLVYAPLPPEQRKVKRPASAENAEALKRGAEEIRNASAEVTFGALAPDDPADRTSEAKRADGQNP